MRIGQRLSTWLDASAAVWFAHWRLIVGIVLVFGAAVLKWVDFSFSHHPFGLQFPFLRETGLVPHLSLLSYGTLGIVVLVIGLLMLWRSTTVLALAAATLLGFWIIAPCQIAFQQPTLLVRLTAEAQQVPMIRSFTKTYLPPNYGPAEDVLKHFELDSLWDRFLAACSFLDLGWYSFGVGSLLIALYAVGRLPGRKGPAVLALSAIPLGVLAFFFLRPLIGQHYFTTGRMAEAVGNNEKATAHYHKVLRWDRWRGQDVGVYRAIGDLERASGIGLDSPGKHISKAEEFKNAREYESAVFELSRAAEWGGPAATAARHESARIRVDFGLALYRDGGIGAAVTQWQQAVVEDPVEQAGLAYLIACGDYDLGRYQASIDALAGIFRVSGDRPILANAYSLAGDCYAKLGRDTDARDSYNLSLTQDNIQNFWALSGFVGN